MLTLGSKGHAVSNLQINMMNLGYPVPADGVFGERTAAAVRKFQADSGIEVDGIVGPATQAAIARGLIKQATSPRPQPVVPPPPPSAIWMDWMKAHEGWNETDNSSQLVKLWKYTTYKSKSVLGAKNAWCAMTVNAALFESGFVGNRSPAAVSFVNFGAPCDIVRGCIIVIQHADGNHHVTFFDHWVDEANKVMACFGGNQSNAIQIKEYNVSGNDKGCDQVIASRWPVERVQS